MAATAHPQIFGILNITADSFSDGGQYLQPDKALAQAQRLVQGGADVLDIGPASSHPDSQPVDAATEIDRLAAVWPGLCELNVQLSIDSFQTATQAWAIHQGVDWLNDIHGFADPSLYPLLADSDCRLVVMHALQAQGAARRQPPPDEDIWDVVLRFFDRRLTALADAGIASSRLVLDPGMGFFLGDRPEPSLRMLSKLAALKAHFDLPVLVSVSRKSFLRHISGRSVEDSGPVTLAAELWAAQSGVDYIRTHDVAQLRDALAVTDMLQQSQ